MKIFVTRKIPEPGLILLRKEHKIEVNPYDGVLTKEEIMEGLKGKDGLLCLLTDTIDEEVISSEPNLKMIASYAVGYNNIDVRHGRYYFLLHVVLSKAINLLEVVNSRDGIQCLCWVRI